MFQHIILLFLLLLPLTIHCFKGLGHALTGAIAFELLTPSEKVYCQTYLDYMSKNYTLIETLGEATRWADDIRLNTHLYDSWHYRTTCYSFDSETICKKSETPNSFTTLSDSMKVLTDKSETMDRKGFYFMFLLHLMGDIHQPLHNTNMFSKKYPQGDIGGNAIIITYMNTSSSLHQFWDNLCEMESREPLRPFSKMPNEQKALEELAEQYLLDYTIEKKDVNFNGDLNTIEKWMNEGYNLAVDYVYDRKVVETGVITEEYQRKCKEILGRQVTLAGARLANVLKYIYEFDNSKNPEE